MLDFTKITYNFDLPIMQILQGSDSLFMDQLIFTLTDAVTWIPLYITLLYIVIRNNETMHQISLVILFAVLSVIIADYIVDVLAKPIFMRPRPCQDEVLKYSIDIVNGYRGGKYGFFSAHASNTMAIALYFSLVIRSKLLTVFLLSWTLLNCYTRIYLGVHYPSDVLVGIAWGCAVAVFTYSGYRYISRKVSTKSNYVSNQYTSTGYSFQDVYIVIIVFLLTLLYALFRAVF